MPVEPRNCWEFWNCSPSAKKECPAHLFEAGRECWLIAGAHHKKPSCPKAKKEFDNCWDCAWFKKLNPGFSK